MRLQVLKANQNSLFFVRPVVEKVRLPSAIVIGPDQASELIYLFRTEIREGIIGSIAQRWRERQTMAHKSDEIAPPVLLDRADAVANGFICVLCHDLPLEPVLTVACEHMFCRTCINESLNHRAECPLCRAAIDADMPYAPGGGLKNLENGLVKRIFDQTRVICPAGDGCDWEGTIGNYRAHAERCQRSRSNNEDSAELIAARDRIEALEAKVQILETEKEAFQERQRSCSNNDDSAELIAAKAQIETMKANIETLQSQVQIVHDGHLDLISDFEDDLTRARAELTRARAERARPAFDHSYNYNRFNVSDLAKIICRNLDDKPQNIDANRIFNCVRNCYMDYTREYTDNPEFYEMDVRMLINICLNCNWFTDKQWDNFQTWAANQGWYGS